MGHNIDKANHQQVCKDYDKAVGAYCMSKEHRVIDSGSLSKDSSSFSNQMDSLLYQIERTVLS